MEQVLPPVPATADGDWASTVCDNCHAVLHPDITVTVAFFSTRSAGQKEPFAVIRERPRSDHRYPDPGQQLTWQLSWEHSTVLAEEARGECGQDVTRIGRGDAERIAPAWPGAIGRPMPPSRPGFATPTRSNPGSITLAKREAARGISPRTELAARTPSAPSTRARWA